MYRKRCEHLQKNANASRREAKYKVDSIRHIYRNLMFYGTSPGTKMVKASINNRSRDLDSDTIYSCRVCLYNYACIYNVIVLVCV